MWHWHCLVCICAQIPREDRLRDAVVRTGFATRSRRRAASGRDRAEKARRLKSKATSRQFCKIADFVGLYTLGIIITIASQLTICLETSAQLSGAPTRLSRQLHPIPCPLPRRCCCCSCYCCRVRHPSSSSRSPWQPPSARERGTKCSRTGRCERYCPRRDDQVAQAKGQGVPSRPGRSHCSPAFCTRSEKSKTDPQCTSTERRNVLCTKRPSLLRATCRLLVRRHTAFGIGRRTICARFLDPCSLRWKCGHRAPSGYIGTLPFLQMMQTQ